MPRRSRSSAVSVAATFACLLAATSCDTPVSAEADGVDRIVLTPSSASVQAGATVTLTALVLDRVGNTMRERKVVWASENTTVATVSQSGVVTAVAAGVVQVAASSGGKSANATVTVTPRPVSLVRVTPGSATISVTGSITLHAEALDASGAPVLGLPVVWTSSNETIAVVSGGGVVAGIAAGSVTISATVGGRTGTAALIVAPQPVASVSVSPSADTIVVGGRVTFRATPLDAQNIPLADRTIAWTSDNPAVATISSTGEVLGLAVGSARVRATVEGKFADATILVQPVPVARVVIAPNHITLNPGQTSQLTVTLNDSVGNVLSGRSITFITSDAQIATVSASGLITAIAEGSAQMQATSEGKTATTVVTVNPIPVASITIAPNAISLRITQTTRLVAQAFDAQGNPLANRTFTWSSGAPSVASVNQSGDVTGVGSGTASVLAATEGISASASVSVSIVPVASVAVTPTALALQQGTSANLSAVTRDSAGNVLSGRAVAWQSSNDAIAVVSGSGRVTAVTPGNVTISASSEGYIGTASVSVSNVPVATVTVTPANPTLGVGQTLGMTAITRDAANNILSGRAVAWASANPAVAAVNATTGVVTAVASGTATVSATSEGQAGSTQITVSVTSPARVDVAPPTVSLNPGQTAQLTATAYDANNNVLVLSMTWSSNSAAVATVSASGLVTAVASGSATISATASGVTGTAIVTVALVPVASVTVTPGAPNMLVGDALTLTATARDAAGNVLSGRPTTWTSSNTSVATVVAATGVVTAVATGAATISATVDGVSSSVAVTISATPVASVTLAPGSASIYQGQQTGFIATARDAGGNVISRAITWSTSSTAVIVNVTQGGVVTAINPGTVSVVATAVGAGAGGTNVSDTASVTVSLVPVASMTLAPKPVSMFISQQQQLTLQLLDSVGGSLSQAGRSITWVSRDPTIAVVSSSGQVAGVASGNTRVVVSTPGPSATVFDSVNVTVSPSPLLSVTVQPKPNTIYQGDARSLRAVTVDALGVVRGRSVSWQTRAASIATVTPVAGWPDSATFVGVSPGSTYVVANDPSGLRDSSLVTVQQVPVKSVVITPATASVDVGNTTQLSAVAKDSAGNTLTRTITWVSLAPNIASVSATGLVTGTAGGSTTIEARANGAGVGGADVVGTAAITVNTVSVPVNKVTVTSPRSFIVPGDTMHLTVVLLDAQNNVLTGRPITFSSNAPGRATVDAAGVVTGVSTAGNSDITATSEGKSGKVQVSSEAGIAAMSVSGPANNLVLDLFLPRTTKKRYTVTVTDNAGNPVRGHLITIANSDPSAMSLSTTSGTTDGSGRATVDVTAGTTTGAAVITFTAPRAGAIPPGAPGSNTPAVSIAIVVL